MAYATSADVLKRINSVYATQMADIDVDGSADSGIIDAFIEDAGREIFKYIKAHHSDLDPEDLTAGSNVPTELRALCCDFVAWFLMKSHGFPDYDEWERLIQSAKDIGNGDASIASPTTRLPESTTDGRGKEFSDKTLRDMGEPPRGTSDETLNEYFDTVDDDINDTP